MPDLAVSFAADDAGLLRGLWRRPAGKGPFASVLCVHGLTLTKGIFDEAAEVFERHGVASLRVDLRGHGESGARLQDQGFDDQVSDVRRAFRAMAAMEGADASRLGLLGFSMGAAMGAVVNDGAGAPVDIKAMALWSPLLRTGPWDRRRREQYGESQGEFRPIWDGILVNERLFSGAVAHDPFASASAFKGPLMVCHGGKDRNHPQGASLALVGRRCEAALPVASYFPPLSGHRWLPEAERRMRHELSASFFEVSL